LGHIRLSRIGYDVWVPVEGADCARRRGHTSTGALLVTVVVRYSFLARVHLVYIILLFIHVFEVWGDWLNRAEGSKLRRLSS